MKPSLPMILERELERACAAIPEPPAEAESEE